MCPLFRIVYLKLIVPGEVKVGLAKFDIIFQTKFLTIRFKKKTYSCRNVYRIFLNF
jgi:hypothetical protein